MVLDVLALVFPDLLQCQARSMSVSQSMRLASGKLVRGGQEAVPLFLAALHGVGEGH